MKIDKLKSLRDETNNLIDSNNKSLNLYTNIRLVVIICLIVTIISAISNSNSRIIFLILSLILFIVSIILTCIMSHYKKIDNHYNYKNLVIKDYLSRFDNSYKSSDTGLDFSRGQYFEQDLDILGKNSIYSYINFSKTAYGKEETAYLLSTDLSLATDLERRQESSKELAENLSDTLDILSSSYEYENINSNIKVKDIDGSLQLLDNKVEISISKLILAPIYFILFCIVIVLSILKIIPVFSPIIMMFIGFILSNFIYPNAKALASDLGSARLKISAYKDLIDVISDKNFKSSYLNELQAPIKLLNVKALKQFNLISGLAESRNNVLFQFLFDGALLIDAYVMYAYAKWQKKYASYLKDSFKAIGKIEGLISISTIRIIKEDSCTPLISETFEFSEIKHPLIKEDVCIPNDFKFIKRNIITGSNMSGKTTFMRSIGTNYTLFLAGADVCARSFKAPILKLFTSMKVVDDVNNNISTFYGEILRIKKIIEYIKEGTGMLVLVDEIFKGTNTQDRIVGAKSFIEKLDKEYIYSIVTTHDPELCQIDNVSNYHFCEHYEGDKILFDYKIHDGISNTRNAIYLLKLAGIVEK